MFLDLKTTKKKCVFWEEEKTTLKLVAYRNRLRVSFLRARPLALCAWPRGLTSTNTTETPPISFPFSFLPLLASSNWVRCNIIGWKKIYRTLPVLWLFESRSNHSFVYLIFRTYIFFWLVTFLSSLFHRKITNVKNT